MILAVLGFGAVAGVGTLIRWDVAGRFTPPVGTLLVNLTGTFALGAAAELDGLTATLVGTAGLGALTTFSTVMLELVELWAVDRRRALAYGALTAAGGLLTAWAGLEVAA